MTRYSILQLKRLGKNNTFPSLFYLAISVLSIEWLYKTYCEHIIDLQNKMRYNDIMTTVLQGGVAFISFLMNGGDVYGTIFFSRLDVLRNVHDSITYVHYIEQKQVILHIEKLPQNFAG